MAIKIGQITANTLASAGTAEKIADGVYAKDVILHAAAANTGILYIGDVDVDTTNGYPLAAGEKVALSALFDDQVDLAIYDLGQIYFDGDTSNDVIRALTFVIARPVTG